MLGEQVVVARPDGREFAGFGYPGSLVVLPTGRLLATFTGVRPRGPHAAVGAYSADVGRSWDPPVTLFGGLTLGPGSMDLGEGYADPNVVVVNQRRVVACCVSLRYDEQVWDLSRTRFWRRGSEDGGETFGPVTELPRHRKYYVGMTHPGLRLRNGTLLMGYSWDQPAEVGRAATGEGTMDLVSGALISRDQGLTWQPGADCRMDVARAPAALPHATNGLDEPAIVELPNGDLFLLGRTGTTTLWQSFSHDGGLTWEPASPSPLTSHNCPAALLRLAGDDTVLVVYNNHPQLRQNLTVRCSHDGCRTWGPPARIGPLGEGSAEAQAAYPNLCQLPDGSILVIFYQIDPGPRALPQTIFGVRFTRDQLAAATGQ